MNQNSTFIYILDNSNSAEAEVIDPESIIIDNEIRYFFSSMSDLNYEPCNKVIDNILDYLAEC